MDLKPCPFCGSEAKVIVGGGSKDFAVHCTNLLCEAATRYWWESREVAVEKWNMRNAEDNTMKYTPKNIDIEAFENALMQSRKVEERRLCAAKMQAQAYFDGFDACLSEVVSMLHCSNYEKREVTSDG